MCEPHSLQVSIIIINRNGIAHLKNLIPALLKHTDSSLYELIFVDNASTDDSISFIKKGITAHHHAPLLQLIKNTKNESFSKANNQAVALARGKYLVLLNNDIEPCADWLNNLLACANNIKNIGSVGAKLIYPDFKRSTLSALYGRAKKQRKLANTLQHTGIAFNNEAFQFRPFNLGKGLAVDSTATNTSQQRVALTAACLLIPKQVYLDVGGLDEAYNYGGEDVDFGLKLLKAGYINYFCAEAVLFHHEFGTQNKEQKRIGALRRSNNLHIFQNKWFLFIKKEFWAEKIYAKSPFYAETSLSIAVLEKNFNKQNELNNQAIAQIKKYGWKLHYLSEKQFKKSQQENTYDFLLSQNNSGCIEIKSQHVNISLESKNWVESFYHYLIQRYLNPSFVLKIAAKKWQGIQSWGDYHMAVSLKKYLQRLGHHVLIQIHPEWDNKEGLEYDAALVFRGLRSYKPQHQQINLMWNISHPDDIFIDEYNSYDQVFIASHNWAVEISKKTKIPVKTLLQCTDVEIFYEPSDKEKQNYKSQLLFVGNSRKVFRKVIKDILSIENLADKYQLAVFGTEWKNFIPKKYIKGEHIANNELYKYYGSADILLNDHWDDMRQKGFISNRIFDALASGATILSDEVSDWGELEGFVETYNDHSDLANIISNCLTKIDGLNEYTAKGKALVVTKHTFERRAKTFSEIVKTHLLTTLS